MTRQNRVRPTGEIVADASRGLFMGNRGILHDATGRLGVSRWKHPHWVCCTLSFKGRRRQVMSPGTYTELFFLDEAVALAAGHRPCAECRRADYLRWSAAWTRAFGQRLSAGEMDRQLHRHRVTRNRVQICYEERVDNLPDGSFVLVHDVPHVLHHAHLWPFASTGYGKPRALVHGQRVTVLTPSTTVAVLEAGYRPDLHFSAIFR